MTLFNYINMHLFQLWRISSSIVQRRARSAAAASRLHSYKHSSNKLAHSPHPVLHLINRYITEQMSLIFSSTIGVGSCERALARPTLTVSFHSCMRVFSMNLKETRFFLSETYSAFLNSIRFRNNV